MSIRIDKLNIDFDGKPVICDLTLELPSKGVVCILGPSGIGKTTLINCLAGLQTAKSGSISGMEGKSVSLVFQENRLLPWVSAEENVAMVVEGDRQRALWALTQMELADEADKLPKELSGGMQRRVAIARALAYGGDILVLDEPTAGLDEALSARILARIIDLWQDKLLIIITHESWVAKGFSCQKFYLDEDEKCRAEK